MDGKQKLALTTSFTFVNILTSVLLATPETLVQHVNQGRTKIQPVPLLVLPVEQPEPQQEQDPRILQTVVKTKLSFFKNFARLRILIRKQ